MTNRHTKENHSQESTNTTKRSKLLKAVTDFILFLSPVVGGGGLGVSMGLSEQNKKEKLP